MEYYAAKNGRKVEINIKNDNLSRDEMRLLQSRRLCYITEYAYNNVAFYRKKMQECGILPDDIKSIDDIEKLPFTTKEEYESNYPLGLLAVERNQIARIQATSGTRGRLALSAYTKHDLDVWSDVMARSLIMAGVSQSDMVHTAYGYGLFTGGLGIHCGAEAIGAAVVPCGAGNTARQIELLKSLAPNVLCCTPSYAARIACEAEAMGVDPSKFGLRCGIFGAEPWSEKLREWLEARYKFKAYDIYGLCEIIGPGVSVECECQNGLHIFEDHFYPEVISTDNQAGELVLTTLTKQGIPLIRYKTRDICSLYREQCTCKRTLVRMSRIKGRTDDMIVIRGINVFPTQIESVLLNMGMENPFYQIIIQRENNLDSMEIVLEAELECENDFKNKLASAVNSALGLSAKITLAKRFTVPRSEGKAVRVVDKRSPAN